MAGGHIHHGELALDRLFTMPPALTGTQYLTSVKDLWLCGVSTRPALIARLA
jgi:phytoene dehydrogenase-like protein